MKLNRAIAKVTNAYFKWSDSEQATVHDAAPLKFELLTPCDTFATHALYELIPSHAQSAQQKLP